MTLRQTVVLALALLLSAPSFGDHPPPPPPAPVPAAPAAPIAAPAWLFWVGALPIIGFAAKHYLATRKGESK